MKPSRLQNTWIKVLPWYYTKKKDPGRFNAERKAIDEEFGEGE